MQEIENLVGQQVIVHSYRDGIKCFLGILGKKDEGEHYTVCTYDISHALADPAAFSVQQFIGFRPLIDSDLVVCEGKAVVYRK